MSTDQLNRKVDTVVITYPTFVDIVVDLTTGEIKREFEAEVDLDKPVCSTTWAEGELLGSSDDGTQSGFSDGNDREAYLRASALVRQQQ